jgi:hypothetical protein
MDLTDLSPALIAKLVADKAWLPLTSMLILFLVRLLKAEKAPAFLDRIPPEARVFIAMLLGQVSGVLDVIIRGTPIWQAIVGGILATACAVFTHDFFVNWLRAGRELGIRKADTAPVPPRPLGALTEKEPPL